MSNFVINTTDNVALVTMNSVRNNSAALAEIFEALKAINVDMICQTAPYKDKINLSFTIDEGDLARTLTAVGSLKEKVEAATEVNTGNSKVTVFSERLKTESGVAAKLFDALSQNGLQIRLITTSDVEISLLVDSLHADRIAKVLSGRLNT